jgi:hypothetical protein
MEGVFCKILKSGHMPFSGGATPCVNLIAILYENAPKIQVVVPLENMFQVFV